MNEQQIEAAIPSEPQPRIAQDTGGHADDGEHRLWLAAGCLSAWLLLLFVGASLGGAVHLLLLAALWLRPWGLDG